LVRRGRVPVSSDPSGFGARLSQFLRSETAAAPLPPEDCRRGASKRDRFDCCLDLLVFLEVPERMIRRNSDSCDCGGEGGDPRALLGMAGLMDRAAVAMLPKPKIAVFVGSARGVDVSLTLKDGPKVHTLWGYVAWRIAGQLGLALMAEAEAARTNPGSALPVELFKLAGPTVIPFDELVAYPARAVDGAAEHRAALEDDPLGADGRPVAIVIPRRIELGALGTENPDEQRLDRCRAPRIAVGLE
jgi:hypothetical protein